MGRKKKRGGGVQQELEEIKGVFQQEEDFWEEKKGFSSKRQIFGKKTGFCQPLEQRLVR